MNLRAVFIVSPLLIGGCAITVPVAAIMQKGVVLRGTASTEGGGRFNVTGPNGLSCGGSYDAWDTSLTIAVTAVCNDGRTAIINVTREKSGLAGGGKIRMSDGSEGDFIFGAAASKI